MDDNPLLRVTPSSPHRWYFRYQHCYAPLLYMLFSPYTIFVYDVEFFFRNRLANLDRGMTCAASGDGHRGAEKLVYMTTDARRADARPGRALVGGGPRLRPDALCRLAGLQSTPGVHALRRGDRIPGGRSRGLRRGGLGDPPAGDLAGLLPGEPAGELAAGAVNAHAAQHLFPDVCHVHYVAISQIIRETAHEYGVRYQRCRSRRPSAPTSGT